MNYPPIVINQSPVERGLFDWFIYCVCHLLAMATPPVPGLQVVDDMTTQPGYVIG